MHIISVGSAVILGLLAGWGAVGFFSEFLRRRREYRVIESRAWAVIHDFHERQNAYPGYYQQPYQVRVMQELEDALTFKRREFR